MKKSVRQKNILIILIIAAILTLGTMLYFKNNPMSSNSYQPNSISSAELKNYTSQDLKISFKHPKDWYVDDRYFKILLTNYITNLNKDDKPSKNEIEILIDQFSGCHPDIEENLKDPACGEGGPSVAKNEIVSKEVKQTKEGIFYRYIVRTPKGNKLAYYLLEKGDKVLQISKQPDPSQFEKEFEELVDSIEFL